MWVGVGVGGGAGVTLAIEGGGGSCNVHYNSGVSWGTGVERLAAEVCGGALRAVYHPATMADARALPDPTQYHTHTSQSNPEHMRQPVLLPPSSSHTPGGAGWTPPQSC